MLKFKQMKGIRVRIAPSPTGLAHIGTAYIALFNYAFAIKNGGKFVLRLEDTDVKREVSGAEEAIYEGLRWLGLSWDEGPDIGGKYGPYRQSERLAIYKEKANELLKKGLAYEDEGAIRFRNPGKDITWNDLVRGEISFPGEEVADFVIMKSDGFPTYHFAVVVDDILMKISHVIRGEDHTSNTPKHIALFYAFGEKPPMFGHLPTLRNKDGKKLSKRRDAVDIGAFREAGYLPEALINFLCLQGWSHPEDKEIFSLANFVENFDVDRIRKSGPIFDTNKLLWLNQQYINNLQLGIFNLRINSFFNNKYPKDTMEKIAPLIQSRIKTLKEFEAIAGFFFEEPKVDKNLFGKDCKLYLTKALEAIEHDRPLEEVPKENNFKTGDFFMDLRVAITGNKITPPLNDSIEILGEEETIKRLKKALE